MERKIMIRKSRSSLYTAAAAAVIFTILAVLFLVFKQDTGGAGSFAFWLFLFAGLAGWYMLIDYMRSFMKVSDEGIHTSNILGKEVFIPIRSVRAIGTNRSFFFVYGEQNRILASFEADITAYEEACEIFKDHGIAIEDRNFRRKAK